MIDNNVNPEMQALLAKAGSMDPNVAHPAMHNFAKALELPLRQGLLAGDIVTDIFGVVNFTPGVPVEFPLDFLSPGIQKDFTAWTMPKHGRLPENNVEGDYLMVPTYYIGNTIDWLLKYSQFARWDVVARAMQVFESGFVKKTNDDGWHTLLAAALDRNVVVYDSDAGSGQFTKRVISLTKTVMRRNAGGNTATANRGRLTDLYLSPENVEDMRNWGVDIVDEVTRREIFTADDKVFSKIFNVNLHDIDELGEGQEYQLFFTQTLGGSLATGDLELMLGLDMGHNDCFIMPTYGNQVEVFEDPALHRQQRHGVYGWRNLGFAILDNRRIVLASC